MYTCKCKHKLTFNFNFLTVDIIFIFLNVFLYNDFLCIIGDVKELYTFYFKNPSTSSDVIQLKTTK